LFKTAIPKRYVYLRLALNLNIASFMLSNFKSTMYASPFLQKSLVGEK